MATQSILPRNNAASAILINDGAYKNKDPLPPLTFVEEPKKKEKEQAEEGFKSWEEISSRVVELGVGIRDRLVDHNSIVDAPVVVANLTESDLERISSNKKIIEKDVKAIAEKIKNVGEKIAPYMSGRKKRVSADSKITPIHPDDEWRAVGINLEVVDIEQTFLSATLPLVVEDIAIVEERRNVLLAEQEQAKAQEQTETPASATE